MMKVKIFKLLDSNLEQLTWTNFVSCFPKNYYNSIRWLKYPSDQHAVNKR